MERLRSASMARDPERLAALYAEDAVLGTSTATGARFTLPNVRVVDVDAHGLIVTLRDYVNPVAVTAALGDVELG